MKNFRFIFILEVIIKIFLFTSIFYLVIDFLILESKNLSFISQRKEFIILLVTISVIGLLFSPLFNVGEYLQTQKVSLINQYKRDYKFDFIISFIGILGIGFWSVSNHLFDTWWMVGFIFIFTYVLCFANLSLPLFLKR